MKRPSPFLGDDKPRLILPLSSRERVINQALVIVGQWICAVFVLWLFGQWFTHPF